jgi:hypothetical protein
VARWKTLLVTLPVFLYRVRNGLKTKGIRFGLVHGSAPLADQGKKERAKSVETRPP